jgi:hypothetical protein
LLTLPPAEAAALQDTDPEPQMAPLLQLLLAETITPNIVI